MKLRLSSNVHGVPDALQQAWKHLCLMQVDRIICTFHDLETGRPVPLDPWV